MTQIRQRKKTEFVQSIIADVEWLGAKYDGDRLHFASNYFDQMYEAAVELIKKGKAYVCDLSAEEIQSIQRYTDRTWQGTAHTETEASKKTLIYLNDMKNGEFPDGSKVLRAKIDMASSEYQHA